MRKDYGYHSEMDECGCEPMDKCAKYKYEAMKQEEEALKLRMMSKKIAEQAECLEEEAEELVKRAKELYEKSEELWEKHGKVEAASFKLLKMANENLEKYIECKEGRKHGCR